MKVILTLLRLITIHHIIVKYIEHNIWYRLYFPSNVTLEGNKKYGGVGFNGRRVKLYT